MLDFEESTSLKYGHTSFKAMEFGSISEVNSEIKTKKDAWFCKNRFNLLYCDLGIDIKQRTVYSIRHAAQWRVQQTREWRR